MFLEKTFRRFRAVAADRIRYSKAMQRILGLSLLIAGLARRSGAGRLARLARAHRILLPVGGSSLSAGRLKPEAPRAANDAERDGNPWRRLPTGWERYPCREVGGVPALSHSLIIKPPVSGNEKGILVIWVEYNLASLLRAPSLPAILENYQIIFSTSWSPPDFALIWALAGEPHADFHVIGSNPQDADWLRQIPVPLTVLPFYASHWICGNDYSDVLGSEPLYDYCAVANWAPFKRHWTLFQALRNLPPNRKIALIGQPEGKHTVDSVRALAEAFGVRQEIDWFNRLEPPAVRRIQAASRCGLMLSMREGSCLAVVESLLADSPVGMFQDAHVGSLDFINERTGIRLNPADLPADLERLLERQKRGEFSPRAWAMEHAEAGVSSRKLAQLLRETATAGGRPWTRNLLPFCLRGARPDYLERDDWKEGKAWHRKFTEEYGIEFIWPTEKP